MAADYIPGADGAFDAWQINFITYASANAAALGLDPLIDIPPLTAAQGVWTTDYPANTAAQAAAAPLRVWQGISTVPCNRSHTVPIVF